MQNAKRAESMSNHAFGGNVSQYEITSELLRNLYKFDLTPVTKLVLLELTTHLNESKNGSVVFPSVNYIAETIGIGLTAAKKAISDLIKKGIIIKSKRDKVRGNYNKYLLRLAKIDFKTGKNENEYKYTQMDINGQKTANKPPENELLKRSDSDCFMITNKNEQINNRRAVLNDDEILTEYAKNHGANNIPAYVNFLKKSGSAKKIINEKRRIVRNTVAMLSLAEKQIQKQREDAINSLPYTTSQAWLCLGKKLGKK